MAVEKVILATKKFSNNWWTISDNNGREINIGTINKKTQAAENQKLNTVLVNANPGDELDVDLRDWQGKLYGNDPKAAGNGFSGSKPFTPADKGFTAANSAAVAASQIMALQKDATYEKWAEMAEKMQAWILSKKAS